MTYVRRIVTHANYLWCHFWSIARFKDLGDGQWGPYIDYGILQRTADTKCKELSYCLFRTECWYLGTNQDVRLLRSNAMSIGGGAHRQQVPPKHWQVFLINVESDPRRFYTSSIMLLYLQNCLYKEIKRRLNPGNPCYHYIQNLLCSMVHF